MKWLHVDKCKHRLIWKEGSWDKRKTHVATQHVESNPPTWVPILFFLLLSLNLRRNRIALGGFWTASEYRFFRLIWYLISKTCNKVDIEVKFCNSKLPQFIVISVFVELGMSGVGIEAKTRWLEGGGKIYWFIDLLLKFIYKHYSFCFI